MEYRFSPESRRGITAKRTAQCFIATDCSWPGSTIGSHLRAVHMDKITPCVVTEKPQHGHCQAHSRTMITDVSRVRSRKEA